MNSRVIFSAKVLLVVCALGFFSCASSAKNLPENITAPELIQKAQELYDASQWEAAVSHYLVLRDRFPNDLTAQCTADYEIAFIRYKQKRLGEARAGFKTLLARYKSPDAELLPAHYKVLAEKTLGKIELSKEE